MSPLGKLTFALLGLRFFGADGFFLGMLLGHLLIDRTFIIKKLEQYLSILNDNIRLLLPYRYYHYYNLIEGNFWGKIWGIIFGGLFFGINGMIILFILGHFIFDTPNSRHAKKYRTLFDELWKKNLGKIAGAIIGFCLHSSILTFVGIILGFFVDYHRLEKGNNAIWQRMRGFWLRVNHLKLFLNAKDAKHVAFIEAMAGLSAKVAKVDGAVNEKEIHQFKQLFEIKENEHAYIAKVFNQAKINIQGYERFAKQLSKIAGENVEMQENIMDNLFKIANCDMQFNDKEEKILTDIAAILGIPEGNFSMIKKRYEIKIHCTQNDYCEILGISQNASPNEIRAKWKELLNIYHPDKLQAAGANDEEIAAANIKMAEINNAYKILMRQK